jgi:hypothetical protein
MITEVIEAGVDSVGVGPAMFDIEDAEIVTPCQSVQREERGRRGHTTAAHRCWENNCPISTSSGAHPSQQTYLLVTLRHLTKVLRLA